MITKRKRKKRLLFLSKLIGATAAAVLLAGVGLSLQQHTANKTADTRATHEIQQANTGQPSPVPSTVKPDESEFHNHKTAADAPRYLFIPKLSVRAIVKPMGLTADGHIQAPANTHYTGWYSSSAKPGQSGAMLIDGHVSNWGGVLSVFHELKKLIPGDIITIERGDGQTFTYAVTKSQSYEANNVDMHAALASINPGTPGLNLITCDGKVVKGNQYDRRLVVFAKQL